MEGRFGSREESTRSIRRRITKRKGKKRREKAKLQLEELKKREIRIIDGWIKASEELERRRHKRIEALLYGGLGGIAIASLSLAVIGTYGYLAGVISGVATLVGVGIAFGEKTGRIPRLGGRRGFEKRLEFIRTRAHEAQREDLLEQLYVNHGAKTISMKEQDSVEAIDEAALDRGPSRASVHAGT